MDHAVALLNPGHSLFPVALLREKAENRGQVWKMMDNLPCFGFLKGRKSGCADLVCYDSGGVTGLFCADEHMGNTFFIELSGAVTEACRRARITKDCPARMSILSNSPASVSLGVPLMPEEF